MNKDEEYLIKRSDNYRYFQLSIVIAVGIVATILTFVMMIETRKVLGIEMGVLGWFVRLGIVLMVVIAAYITNREFMNRRYVVNGNRLSITQLRFGTQKSKKLLTLNHLRLRQLA